MALRAEGPRPRPEKRGQLRQRLLDVYIFSSTSLHHLNGSWSLVIFHSAFTSADTFARRLAALPAEFGPALGTDHVEAPLGSLDEMFAIRAVSPSLLLPQCFHFLCIFILGTELAWM